MTDRIFLGHTTAIVTQSITRPGDTTAYAAGDVIGTAASQILDFTDAARGQVTQNGVTVGGPGGSGMLSTALLIDSANQATPPSLELWLFTAAPAAQIDNAPFAVTDAEMANLVGIIPLAIARIGNVSAAAAGNLAIQSDVATLAFKCAPSTTHLYGILVVRNAYTPVANEVFTVKLSALQDY